ncbi:hypothetical protein [Halorarius litoreus]|uniref:hypothetical protein n=1 Tax=Halorarius litoreus TaxID=2962676 RepID=UPI0020CCA756|nr:hypothetical protein [Halorarius litoreus]
MYRTVTRLLGLSRASRGVNGTVVGAPANLTVDHAASPRWTSDGTHLAVTVRVQNEGSEPLGPTPVRVRFYESRWLGATETALEPVARATDCIEPGDTATVEVGWSDSVSVSRYDVEVGSEME